MLKRLKQWLQPPVYANEEQNQIARLLHKMLLFMIASLMIAIPSLWLVGQDTHSIILAIVWGVMVCAFWLSRRSQLMIASLLLVGTMHIGVLALVLAGDGTRDEAMIIFPLVIILASALLTRRFYLAFVLFMLMSIWAIVYGHLNNLLIAKPLTIAYPAMYLTLSLIFGTTAVAARLLSENMRRNLNRAQRNERQLAVINQQLEQKVEERAAALQVANEKLLRQEKLTLLGQLAGGIAHEMRNPLGVITNAVYFLQAVNETPDEITREYLDIIANRVSETEGMVSSLLDFARVHLPVPEAVYLAESITAVLQTQPPPAIISVTNTVTNSLSPILADQQHLRQILTNLITNAYDAMPDGGTLTLTAQSISSEIHLEINDTGEGMSPETQAQIFEPLFSTKVHGIGLGLSIVKNLVELNNGRISLTTTEGKGTTFNLTLPRAQTEEPG